MKIYRYIVKVFVAALMVLGTGCSGPRVIPDDILVKIFHDAYIANAYMEECRIRQDSLLIYEPIFQRYGYTMEDLQYTITNFTERKSAMLSDIMGEENHMLDAESRREAKRMIVLDTIDNIAKRQYTRTIYADTLIRVKRLRDSSKLRITIEDIIPADYNISFDYHIDTLDENRNSRIEVMFIDSAGKEKARHTMMMSRYRDGKYTHKMSADSSTRKLFINIFYHPANEESKTPDITVRNLKVVRHLPTEVCVDSLYLEQLDIRLFNHDLMTGFTADTVALPQTEIITADSITHDEPQDSITLRTN